MSDPLLLGINTIQTGTALPKFLGFSEVNDRQFLDISYWENLADLAERGTLDALFLADVPNLRDPAKSGIGRFEPFTFWTRVAAHAQHIGFVATATTTLNDPYELAERTLSADVASGGRFAWNAVTTFVPNAALNYGSSQLIDRDTRYRRAREFIAVVQGLWASAATGEQFTFNGDFLSVSGTLKVPRSAQGQPLVFQAGGSPDGRDLASQFASGVFTAELDIDAAREHRTAVREGARKYGRDGSRIRILPGLLVTLGQTRLVAQERWERLEEFAEDFRQSTYISSVLGTDILRLDQDAPFPEEILADPDTKNYQLAIGFRDAIIRDIRARNTTVREYLHQTRYRGSGHGGFVGTPAELADHIETWFRAGAADGFIFMPDAYPETVELIVDQVIPILRERGLFKSEYTTNTISELFAVDSASEPSRRSA